MHLQRTLIVCERTDQWAVGLRQALSQASSNYADLSRSEPSNSKAGRDAARGANESSAAFALASRGEVRLIETRTPADCLAALADAPHAVVAVELRPADCDEALSLLSAVSERYAGACVILVAAREMASYEWLARELGAAHFVSSPRRLHGVAEVASRHWANLPTPALGTAETVWATLPWK